MSSIKNMTAARRRKTTDGGDQAATLRVMARGENEESKVVSLRTARKRRIAVTGGKGGVGKSTVALNLAVTYGQLGSRTVAVDGDLGMADLNLLLGLAPGRSMLDVLEGAALEQVLVEAHGIHLLPALNGSHRLANLDERARKAVSHRIAELEQRFETIVVDTAAGIATQTMTLAASATDVILVATPEPLSLADAYACLKVLVTQHGLTRAFVVPNNVVARHQAEEVHAQLSALVDRFLGIELIALPAVPYDAAIPMAAGDGVPLVVARPDSVASRSIQKIARALDIFAAVDHGDRGGTR